MNNYSVGQSVTVQATFSVNGVNTDPTVIDVKTIDPSGNFITVTYPNQAMTNPAVGIYTYTFTPGVQGEWYYRFEATGLVIAAQESSLYAGPTRFS